MTQRMSTERINELSPSAQATYFRNRCKSLEKTQDAGNSMSDKFLKEVLIKCMPGAAAKLNHCQDSLFSVASQYLEKN
jgi:hypothetical protein